MSLTRRSLFSLAGLGIAGLAACQREHFDEQPQEPVQEQPAPQEEPPQQEPPATYPEFEDLALDMDGWRYDELGDCYYQLAVPYCLTPANAQYESLSIFVPGAYLVGTPHGDTYHCELAPDAQVGHFTAQTAPVALPINVPTFGAQECPTTYSYEGLDRYLQAGIVYVYAGFRGRSGGYDSTTQEYFAGGAPWPVVDLKATVRFLRYNAAQLPCDLSRIFAFGLGAAGGLASALGCGGNASCFAPYLQEIGAVTHDLSGAPVSDEIAGVAAWCPIGSFVAGDAAYEWMVGQYASDESRAEGTWTKLLSDDLSQAYGDYLNNLGLVDADGVALELDQIEDGRYASGSYYDYLVRLIASSAADFFARTSFPYTTLPLMPRVRLFPGNPSVAAAVSTDTSSITDDKGTGISGVRQVQATVYDTLKSYIASLNGDSRWLTYNASRGEADVTGLWSFVRQCRPATRGVCAYDQIDRSGLANQLFGTDKEPSLHFDALAGRLVEDNAERYAQGAGWSQELVSEWRGDLVETDALSVTVTERVSMMDPLSLLAGDIDIPALAVATQEGAEAPEVTTSASAVAAHWRINTGLFQSESTFTSEVNLACARAACDQVHDVAFEPVWGAGFELAERAGDPEDNLIAWICACLAADGSTEEGEGEATEAAPETEPSEEN